MKDGDSPPELCCPRFDPEPWDDRIHDWDKKLFIMDTIREVFHRPLPGSMKKTVGSMWKKAKDAGADPDPKDFLLLSRDPSPWKSELYMTVTKEVPGAENVRLSGTYITKIFDGAHNSPPRWIKEMDSFVRSKGETPKEYLFYFTTCPRCAKAYGHNYAVVFAKI